MRETIDVDISGLGLRFEGLTPALAAELTRQWPDFVSDRRVSPALTIRIEDDGRVMRPGRYMEGELRIETSPDAVMFRRDEGELVQDVPGVIAVARLARGDSGRRFWGLVNLACAAVGWRLQQLGGGVVHAAGIVAGGSAYLLVGPSGSGKTTWARTAAAAGLSVLSDDCVLVQPVDRRVWALGSPFRSSELPSPGPGRWPVAAFLIPEWSLEPSLAPASRLALEARIASNLLFSTPAWATHTSAAGAAAAIASGAPGRVLSFRPDGSWIPLLTTIG